MFMVWTIVSLWILLVFDQALPTQSIAGHSVQSLLLFVPTSAQGWGLIISWMVPLVFMMARTLYSGRKIFAPFDLGAVGNMAKFDWIAIVLALALALLGWMVGTAALLLLSTVAAIGLILNKFEQWFVG